MSRGIEYPEIAPAKDVELDGVHDALQRKRDTDRRVPRYEDEPTGHPGTPAYTPPINRQDYGPHVAQLSTDPKTRKEQPMARGLLDYFPDALAEVAGVSFRGNQQHNPGQDLHWAKDKSTDHADCAMRHLTERGTRDKTDGERHSAKLAWRALALCQTEIEAERKAKAGKTS